MVFNDLTGLALLPKLSRVASLAFCFAAAAWGQTSPETTPVEIVPLRDQSIYPNSIAPDALAFACAGDKDALAPYFAERGLPFEEVLVRPWQGRRSCHVYYLPTIKGFRASRDNAAVRGLYAAVHPMHFLAHSDMPGYNLDIAKAVLGRLPRPIEVRISVAGDFDKEFWAPAAESHFGGMPHDFTFVESGSLEMHPWAQDHIKGGQVDGRLRELIPRRLYEGREEDGELTAGMLDKLQRDGFVRSKLSWEGGGLQFVASPRDKSKTILSVGLLRYWGKDLTDAEYNYVLRTEFGADLVLDLNPVVLHSDYVVAFLPGDNTALVSRIIRTSAEVARPAAFALLESFGEEKPPQVRRLASLLAEWSGTLADRPPRIQRAIEGARREIQDAKPEQDAELDGMISRYVAANCPGNPSACFAAANEMLRRDPELVRRSSSYALGLTAESLLREMLIGIVEDQLDPSELPEQPLLEEAAEQLTQWGFRVVRVPHLSSGGVLRVSYVNSLLVGPRLFMPTLGLGRFEERMFTQLTSELSGQYEIIPVDARRVLMLNGGLHCVFGILRYAEPSP